LNDKHDEIMDKLDELDSFVPDLDFNNIMIKSIQENVNENSKKYKEKMKNMHEIIFNMIVKYFENEVEKVNFFIYESN